jgi:hypothetical protein
MFPVLVEGGEQQVFFVGFVPVQPSVAVLPENASIRTEAARDALTGKVSNCNLRPLFGLASS